MDRRPASADAFPRPGGAYRIGEVLDEERREEVYAFRYAHYYRHLPGAEGVDAAGCRVVSPHDAASTHIVALDPEGRLLAVGTGTPADLPGLPEHWKELLDLPRLAAFDLSKVLVYSRLVERPDCRGGTLFLEFFKHCARLFTAAGFRHTVHYCAPSLVALYERLGYRCYGRPRTLREGTFRIPMILNVIDHEHLRRAHPAFLRATEGVLPPADEALVARVLPETGEIPLCLQDPPERLEHVRRLAPVGAAIPDSAAAALRRASIVDMDPGTSPLLWQAPADSTDDPDIPDPPPLWHVLSGSCTLAGPDGTTEERPAGSFIDAGGRSAIRCTAPGKLLLLGTSGHPSGTRTPVPEVAIDGWQDLGVHPVRTAL
ncbi:MAG: hypothetical protein LBR22_02220 [Desulfovibrio sp.]|jgi:hypothetical protein|nr:hypothetical protein [Desulfovibrio sp.]